MFDVSSRMQFFASNETLTTDQTKRTTHEHNYQTHVLEAFRSAKLVS